MAVLAALLQPFVDGQTVVASLPQKYDLDVAVGVQLDTVGLWVGASRFIEIPISGVYFAFDTAGLGLDQGAWYGPYDSVSGLTRLGDDDFRTYIRAKILDNKWDGTVPHAYQILNKALPTAQIIIQDNQDMSMLVGTYGAAITNAVQYALLTHGYLDIKPVGVRIAYYISPSAAGPLFGFDVTNSVFAGFDAGSWATLTPGR